MRYLRLIVCCLVTVAITLLPVACTKTDIAHPAVPSGPSPPVAAPVGKTWALTFDVEFEGTSLDTTKLTPCFDWNYGECTSSFNNGKEHYLPSQVQLSNGVAHLVAEPLDPPHSSDACFKQICTYKSGLLSTARPDQSSPYLFQFTYGYVEGRMKLPATPGMFTGFWMVPAHPDFNYATEIDIVENLGGKPDVIYQTYHYDDRNESFKVNDITNEESNGACPKVDYSADFHTYGVDWQKDHIAFYIDGKECGRFTPTDHWKIPSEPMQIIMNLSVDTAWPRQVNLVLPSQTVTDQLDVDYLRVWQAH